MDFNKIIEYLVDKHRYDFLLVMKDTYGLFDKGGYDWDDFDEHFLHWVDNAKGNLIIAVIALPHYLQSLKNKMREIALDAHKDPLTTAESPK